MNLYQKLSLLTLSLIYCSNLAISSENPPVFRPTLSFLVSYTHTKNFSHLNDGKFIIENKKGNFGFELTNKFYASEGYFLKTGIRYHQYKKTVTAINQIPEIYDFPPPYSWELKYSGVNIPILIGKDFVTKKGKGGDFYFGLAPGILMNTYKQVNGDITRHRDPNDTNPVYAQTWDQETDLPNFYFVTADLGINIRPVKSIPGFNIGALCSFQLNKAQASQHNGNIIVPDKGYDFLYDLHNENRVMNFSLMFSYTFGKKA